MSVIVNNALLVQVSAVLEANSRQTDEQEADAEASFAAHEQQVALLERSLSSARRAQEQLGKALEAQRNENESLRTRTARMEQAEREHHEAVAAWTEERKAHAAQSQQLKDTIEHLQAQIDGESPS